MEKFGYYWELAQAGLARGFGTKQAKKDALEYVGRAFDEIMKGIRDKLLAPGVDREATKAMYWGTPAAHVWKEKHAKLFAQFPEEVAKANEVAAFRAKVVATEVVKKPPVRTPAQIKKDAEAKTCQICGRKIFAEVGLIAHHGYQRPGDGWQTASCYGARELPFEVGRAVLGKYIVRLEAQLVGMVTFKRKVLFEEVPVAVGYQKPLPKTGDRWAATKYETINLYMTRKNAIALYEEHKKKAMNWYGLDVPYDVELEGVFDYFLKKKVAMLQKEIIEMQQYIKFQQGRYDGWQGKLIDYVDGKWVKV